MVINFARKERTAAGWGFDYVLHRGQYQYITDSGKLASLIGVMYDNLKKEQAALAKGTAAGDKKAARIRARSCR